MCIVQAVKEPQPRSPRTPLRRSHAERSRTTREHLIATAIDVLRKRGYQGATMFELAKAAGVTPGALQHHFGSKVALMTQVVDEIMRSGNAAGAPLPDASLPLDERARRFVRALWQANYEAPRFLSAWSVYFGASAEPELRDHIAGRRAEQTQLLHGRFLTVFPELAAEKQARDLTDLVLSALRGIGVARLFGPANAATAGQLDALAQLIVLRCQVAAPAARKAPRRTAR